MNWWMLHAYGINNIIWNAHKVLCHRIGQNCSVFTKTVSGVTQGRVIGHLTSCNSIFYRNYIPVGSRRLATWGSCLTSPRRCASTTTITRQTDRQTGRMVKRSDTQYLSLVYIDARYIDMGFLSVRPSVCAIVHVGVASNQSQTFLYHLAWHQCIILVTKLKEMLNKYTRAWKTWVFRRKRYEAGP